MIALGRVGMPDDVGPAVAGLLGSDNRWVTAQRIEVSGGQNIGSNREASSRRHAAEAATKEISEQQRERCPGY